MIMVKYTTYCVRPCNATLAVHFILLFGRVFTPAITSLIR